MLRWIFFIGIGLRIREYDVKPAFFSSVIGRHALVEVCTPIVVYLLLLHILSGTETEDNTDVEIIVI